MALALLALLILASDPATIPAKSSRPPLVCRESVGELGSHIRTGRRCLTQEQWDREDDRRSARPPTLQVIGEQGDGQQRPARPQ